MRHLLVSKSMTHIDVKKARVAHNLTCIVVVFVVVVAVAAAGVGVDMLRVGPTYTSPLSLDISLTERDEPVDCCCC